MKLETHSDPGPPARPRPPRFGVSTFRRFGVSAFGRLCGSFWLNLGLAMRDDPQYRPLDAKRSAFLTFLTLENSMPILKLLQAATRPPDSSVPVPRLPPRPAPEARRPARHRLAAACLCQARQGNAHVAEGTATLPVTVRL